MPGPAYRVRTPRLLLRSWNPEDAPRLLRSVTESLDHLLPWLPWAKNEPEPLDEKVTRLRTMRGNFDLGKDFVYTDGGYPKLNRGRGLPRGPRSTHPLGLAS